MPITKVEKAYKVEIFIAGDYDNAIDLCIEYCNDVGLCVTVERCYYAYTGGGENGVRVGLINYARFPKSQRDIWDTARILADKLLTGLGQGSYTVQDHEETLFYSERPEDNG